MGLTFGVGLTLSAGNLLAQAQEPTPQTTVDNTKAVQDHNIQQLQEKLEEIQKELMELEKATSAAPETHHTTTAKASPPPSPLTEPKPKVTNPPNPPAGPSASPASTR